MLVIYDYELTTDNMLVVDRYLRIINTFVISNKFNMIKPQNNKQLKKYWVSWEARYI